VNTFETLETLFLQDLCELRRLQKRRWFVLPMTRVVKEEHLGRCCYFAEEFLNPADLAILKHEIGLDEQQWRVFKMKVSGP
jgi:hypothetical protein